MAEANHLQSDEAKLTLGEGMGLAVGQAESSENGYRSWKQQKARAINSGLVLVFLRVKHGVPIDLQSLKFNL